MKTAEIRRLFSNLKLKMGVISPCISKQKQN